MRAHRTERLISLAQEFVHYWTAGPTPEVREGGFILYWTAGPHRR